ncbi:MAG: hypothetical protein HGB11_02000 [Chlorobiales bacterium]|nr:hypothetical protein [Chlorobiales bacterium]
MTAMKALIMIALAVFTYMETAAQTNMNLRLSIRQDGDDEKIITRANLLKIKAFILASGQRETYCNMYNNNPACHTRNFHVYLNPDTGQQNINCDTEKSDFNNLTIKSTARGKNPYRTVEFIDEHTIYVTATWPTDDLTVGQLRKLVEDGMKELLAEMDQRKPK